MPLKQYSPHTEYDVLMKTVIIGDSGVGKSSLLHQYTDNEWCPTYIATIGVDFKMDTFETQGKVVKMQMWDTAGQERFRTICAAYYRGAHCIMLVYDVTNRESFENVKHWMKEVEHNTRPNLPTMLVGNKVDQVADREVSQEEAESFAAKHNMVHIEASAKSSHNVSKAFRSLADHALQRNGEIQDDTAAKRARIIHLANLAAEEKQPSCAQRFLRFFGL